MSKVLNKLTNKAYFITGTDTDVGKTVCTKGLLQFAKFKNKSCLAYKPISAGCELTKQGLRNSDALTLQNHSSIKVAYQAVNPIAYQPAIAPHIAAAQINQKINLNVVDQGYDYLLAQQADLLLVEGAGGWHLPMNNSQLFSEWVTKKQLPVIVVVGLKLGCLNHALLTVQAIQQSGLIVAGWIANHLQPEMPFAQANIDTLLDFIDAPLIAEIPFLKQIESQDLTGYFNLELS